MLVPRLLVLAAAASAAILAPAAAARAADVTVSTAPQLTTALAAASASASPTHVKLTPGSYAGSFAYTGSQPLEVTGAGAASTGIVASGADAGLWLKSTSATYHVADLGFSTSGSGDALKVEGAGLLERVTGKTVGDATGWLVRVRHGGVTLRQSSLSGAGAGVYTDEPGTLTVADLSLSGLHFGMVAQGKGVQLEATRVRMTGVGFDGVTAGDGAHVTLSDALITLTGPQAVGLAAYNVNGAASSVLTARRSTLVGEGAGLGQAGALAVVQAGDHNTVELRDSVLDQIEVPLACSAPKAGGIGRVSADYSRVPVGSGSTCGKDGVAQLHPVQAVDPGFADAASGDFGLKAGSPLLDAGDPADVIGDTDLAGAPRPVASVAGGTARGDLGAYERQPAAVLAPAPQAPVDPADPSAGPPTVDPGQDPAGPPTTPRDTVAPVLRALKATRAGVRVSVSEAATALLTITPAHGRAVTRVLSLKAGAQVLAPRAAGLRGLRAGRYRVTLTARDAAGNVSTPSVATLRIKR